MTTSISDIELAALIADLTTPTPPPVQQPPCLDPFCIGTPGGGCGHGPNEHVAHHGAKALAAALKSGAAIPPSAAVLTGEPRCTVTELLAAQCSHCRPAPPTERRDTTLGPWIPAAYKGVCGSCGGRFGEGEQIRSDGAGGWLADCCGNIGDGRAGERLAGLLTPATIPGHDDGIREINHTPEWDDPTPARTIPAGPPASTVKELRQVLVDFERSRPRSMQVALGPSELGTPCQQQIARKLAGAPRRPITDPTWAPFQGTAVHRSMEDVVAFWNAQLGRERWLAEDRLTVDPGLPGVDPIEGNGDAFDTDWAMVVDWKHTGKTALDKLRRGKRMNKPPTEQVSQEYRVQGHLYGYGHARKGRDVRWVRLVLLARSHDYDESEEWTEAYNPDIAIEAITRYYATHDLLDALDVKTQPELISIAPATPSRDTCKWCPFHRSGQPSTWNGCPGDTTLEKLTARATRGLIA